MRFLKLSILIFSMSMLILPLLIADAVFFAGCDGGSDVACDCVSGSCPDSTVCTVNNGQCVIKVANDDCVCGRAVTF